MIKKEGRSQNSHSVFTYTRYWSKCTQNVECLREEWISWTILFMTPLKDSIQKLAIWRERPERRLSLPDQFNMLSNYASQVILPNTPCQKETRPWWNSPTDFYIWFLFELRISVWAIIDDSILRFMWVLIDLMIYLPWNYYNFPYFIWIFIDNCTVLWFIFIHFPGITVFTKKSQILVKIMKIRKYTKLVKS